MERMDGFRYERDDGGVALHAPGPSAPAGLRAAAAPHLERLPAFPTDEEGHRHEHHDERARNHHVGFRQPFQMLDDLRAGLHTGNGADDHDQAELEVHVAQCAVLLGGDDGFAHDVRQVGADDEIHRHACGKQRRPGDETATDTKESSQDADNESHRREIERIDVDAGDGEIHASTSIQPALEKTQQGAGENFQEHALANDQGQRYEGVSGLVRFEEIPQRPAEEMQHQEEVTGHQHRIHHQLQQKRHDRQAG